MRFEIGRIDHDRLALSTPSRQAIHHRDEDPFVAPTLSAVVERLGRTRFPRRIAPPQTVAIEEDNAAQHSAIIDPRPAMAPRGNRA